MKKRHAFLVSAANSLPGIFDCSSLKSCEGIIGKHQDLKEQVQERGLGGQCVSCGFRWNGLFFRAFKHVQLVGVMIWVSAPSHGSLPSAAASLVPWTTSWGVMEGCQLC